MVLMEPEALVCRQILILGPLVIMIDLGEGFDHITTLFREARDQIHEVAPGMSETVGQKGLKLLGHIAAQGITHLDGWAQTRGPLFKEFGHILSGMFLASKEEGHAALVSHGKHPRGETPFS